MIFFEYPRDNCDSNTELYVVGAHCRDGQACVRTVPKSRPHWIGMGMGREEGKPGLL